MDGFGRSGRVLVGSGACFARVQQTPNLMTRTFMSRNADALPFGIGETQGSIGWGDAQKAGVSEVHMCTWMSLNACMP